MLLKQYTQEKDFYIEKSEICSELEQLAREGARKMLEQALEWEVEEYILPSGSPVLMTGINLPALAARSYPDICTGLPSVTNLIPFLYLNGISTNDFPQALNVILGEGVKGLSPANIVRLKNCWEADEEKYPKAVECLTKDSEDLFTFYDFPALHWMYIRTTNPIESTFATVRLRTKRTKNCGFRQATLSMVFKLAQEAEKNWLRLRGYQVIPLVLEGRKFRDGKLVEKVM